MKLEEILDDPQKAFVAGWKLQDAEFEPLAERIIEVVSADSRQSYVTGKYWSDERFARAATRIAQGAAKNPNHAYLSLLEWTIERIELTNDILYQGIAASPRWSEHAGRSLEDERFNNYSELIAYGVTLDEKYFKEAQDHWRDKRFLMASLLKNFPDVEERKRISGQVHTISQEKKTDYLYLRIHTGEALTLLDEYDLYRALRDVVYARRTREGLDYLVTQIKFKAYLGNKIMRNLTTLQADIIMEAYSFAVQAKQEKQFFEGLKTNIVRGTDNKYCKTIIQYFRGNAQGAGNYRMIEVAA